MEHRFTTEIGASRARVFDVIANVDTYADWLEVVQRVEPATGSTSSVDGAAEGPAWFVTLRAKLGPLARSKRLRVAPDIAAEPSRFRLVRTELDGRNHSPWIFDSSLDEAATDTTKLTMTLTYGGSLWSPALTGVLERQLTSAAAKLETLATTG